MHKHEMRLRMDAAIGRAPAISDLEMQVSPCPALVPMSLPVTHQIYVFSAHTVHCVELSRCQAPAFAVPP